MIDPLLLDLIRAASQLLTGKLLTEEQIKSVSKNTVVAYFSDWLPTPKKEAEAKARVEKARFHIGEASRIISGLQDDLSNQAQHLDGILREIEEKKKQADHYAILAQTNEEVFSAFRAEMEEALRKELV